MDLKKLLVTLQQCYDAGFDAGKNGANQSNSHFKFFSSPEKTKAWEEGKEAAANDVYKKLSPKMKKKWNATQQQQ